VTSDGHGSGAEADTDSILTVTARCPFSRNEDVVDVKWPVCMAVQIDCGTGFRALGLTEELVVSADYTRSASNFTTAG
jgi:hypothetical protein